MMRKGNMLISRMRRLLLLLLAVALVPLGQMPFGLAQTSKFEGTYKGTIVLDSASNVMQSNLSCDPTTKNFEQIMTISGDRIYLERKAVQQNVMFSGTINSEGSASASGVQRGDASPNMPANTVFTLIGRIANNEFTGTISNRRCGYSVNMKK